MVGITRDLSQHKQILHVQGEVERQPSPIFAPPVPAYMREPGTNYYTLITAPGPHDTERP